MQIAKKNHHRSVSTFNLVEIFAWVCAVCEEVLFENLPSVNTWQIGAKDEPGGTLIVDRKRLTHSMFLDENQNCFCSYCGLLLNEKLWRVIPNTSPVLDTTESFNNAVDVERYFKENFFILNLDFVKHVPSISDF